MMRSQTAMRWMVLRRSGRGTWTSSRLFELNVEWFFSGLLFFGFTDFSLFLTLWLLECSLSLSCFFSCFMYLVFRDPDAAVSCYDFVRLLTFFLISFSFMSYFVSALSGFMIYLYFSCFFFTLFFSILLLLFFKLFKPLASEFRCRVRGDKMQNIYRFEAE